MIRRVILVGMATLVAILTFLVFQVGGRRQALLTELERVRALRVEFVQLAHE